MPPEDPFVAEFTLSSPDIRGLAELVPDAELRLVDEFRDQRGLDHGIFWVAADDFERFEESLSASTLIDSWECLVESDSRRLYDILVTKGSELAEAIELSREYTIVWQVMTTQHSHLFVSAIVPDRTTLQAFREELRTRGFDFTLRRVTSEIDTEADGGPSISDAQREVLELAYERGYYQQPRAVTLAEIGAELGISESAVSGRLNRGLSQLIADCLDVDDPPADATR